MKLGPAFFISLVRILYLLFLLFLWLMDDNPVAGFMFILLLACMAGLRWRFRLPAWTSLIDLLFCIIFMFYWSESVYGAALPLFESVVKGRARYAIFVLLIFIGKIASPLLLCWHLVQAGFLGVLLRYWEQQREADLLEADRQRQARHDLEQLKTELLEASSKAMQLAEVAERHRIARELHDHLGHDLTGALLGLQAYGQLADDKQKQSLLRQVVERLERSTKTLRDTVHDITPVTRLGSDQLEFIATHFFNGERSVDYRQTGNMLLVPAHMWGLLESCLKEALTNIAKHSSADQVEIQLDVTETIVRLSVQDNGGKDRSKERQIGSKNIFTGTQVHKEDSGSGIRHLKIRARAAGGSVSVDQGRTGFRVVCVLPIEGGRVQ